MKKEDLHKIAPKLSEITLDKTGFKIPENYFETVEDAVLAELKAINLPKKTTTEAYSVPDNYFNSLEDIVLTKLKAEAIQQENKSSVLPDNYFNSIEDSVLGKIKTSKVISLRNRIVRIAAPIAIAASLLLIFTLNNNTNSITFESLAISDIEDWIDSGNLDIDASSIALLYPEIEINDENYGATISDDEVLEYLFEEDLEEIIYDN